MYIHLLFSLDCPAGYIGENCSIPCRYPSFGHACHGRCNCNESDCLITSGCKGWCFHHIYTNFEIKPTILNFFGIAVNRHIFKYLALYGKVDLGLQTIISRNHWAIIKSFDANNITNYQNYHIMTLLWRVSDLNLIFRWKGLDNKQPSLSPILKTKVQICKHNKQELVESLVTVCIMN
jgi:hypothetical protein